MATAGPAPDGGAEQTEALFDELQELHDIVDSDEERDQVQEAMRAANRAERTGIFGRVVSGFGSEDVAEALLGSVIFGIPMLVEGGTLEIGEFLAAEPLFLGVTYVVTVLMVWNILYAADFQDVRITYRIFGVLPRRPVAILAVSFGTALFAMTLWGRVTWSEPVLALAQVSVTFVPMAIGAALGDILPGT